MVDIQYRPIKELIVHEVIELSLEDLLRSRITPAGNMPLYWCNKILFSFTTLPLVDDVLKDYLNGKLHWAEVLYCKMEEYKEEISLNDEAYKGEQRFRVINTNVSEVHREFTKWLANR
ncbi:MAG: hypothetical protein QXL16_01715 [Candidatus Micrarchaeaceae archaeon]